MTTPSAEPDARIIGIDCATDPKNVGLALCTIRHARPRIDEVIVGKSWPAIDEQVARWATATPTGAATPTATPTTTTPTLFALDAPLGWPALLGASLHAHHAGAGLDPPANALFRRSTDDAIAQRLGKRPLDVGSDRIARTAHSALSFLARLRKRLDAPIPLAWQPGPLDTTSAIEVYPAGTLAARDLPSSGYKGPSDAATARRQQLADVIAQELFSDEHALGEQALELMVGTDHALDAVLCVCAGLDFLAGDVVPPDDLRLAKQEGWIWVRPRRP